MTTQVRAELPERARARRRAKRGQLPVRAGKLPVTATIIALNEADRIGECLESLRDLVDQVVVVDSGSEDSTIDIARQAGADVHSLRWEGYGPQKRRAEDLSRHDWILNIDADERLSPELADEIREAFAEGPPDIDAYRLRIVDQFPHEGKPARWAYSYKRVRLYDRRAGRFSESLVHDDVAMPERARIGELRHPMAHVSFRDLSAWITKLNRYTDMQIEDMVQRGRRIGTWRLLSEFPFAFLKSYILRRRVFYGWWGIILSMTYAYIRFLRVAKAYEIQSQATQITLSETKNVLPLARDEG